MPRDRLWARSIAPATPTINGTRPAGEGVVLRRAPSMTTRAAIPTVSAKPKVDTSVSPQPDCGAVDVEGPPVGAAHDQEDGCRAREHADRGGARRERPAQAGQRRPHDELVPSPGRVGTAAMAAAAPRSTAKPSPVGDPAPAPAMGAGEHHHRVAEQPGAEHDRVAVVVVAGDEPEEGRRAGPGRSRPVPQPVQGGRAAAGRGCRRDRPPPTSRRAPRRRGCRGRAAAG